MRIEFATSIDDYDLSNFSEKLIKALKENMACTLFSEKVPVFRQYKPKNLLVNQTHWSLI